MNMNAVEILVPDGKPPVALPAGSIAEGAPGSPGRSVEFENLVHVRAQGPWYAMRDLETLRVQLAAILNLMRQNLNE